MKIDSMQEPRTTNNNQHSLKIIEAIHKNLEEKRYDEAQFQSQLCGCYGSMLMADECKKHAALVPDWAHAQEKTHAQVSLARLLVYEKNIEAALGLYQQAYKLNNEHTTAIEEAGWCCCELKQWEQAQDWFTKGTLVEDAEWIMWEGLGFALTNQKKYEEALVAYKVALEMSPEESHGSYYHHLIGQCYIDMGDFYRALAQFTKCLDYKHSHANAMNNIAALYFNMEGDMGNAIDCLKKAEAAAVKDGDNKVLQNVYTNLARIYGDLKEFELQEHYSMKLMEAFGFGDFFGLMDDGDEL